MLQPSTLEFKNQIARVLAKDAQHPLCGSFALAASELLNREPGDIDILSSSLDDARATMKQDRAVLERAGYAVTVNDYDRSGLSAQVSRGGLSAGVDWSPVSDMVCAPVKHKEFGHLLNPFDIAMGHLERILSHPFAPASRFTDLLHMKERGINLHEVREAVTGGGQNAYAEFLDTLSYNRHIASAADKPTAQRMAELYDKLERALGIPAGETAPARRPRLRLVHNLEARADA